MTRERYRHSRSSDQRRGAGAPRRGGPRRGWPWLTLGLLLGIGAAVWFLLHGEGPHHTPTQSAALTPPAPARPKAPPKTSQTAAGASTAQSNEPTFDFYKVLPEFKVDVPESVTPERHKETPRPPPPPAKVEPATTASVSSGGYLLQAGAFRSHADADRLKARLALLGYEARIQTVSGGSREDLHRVRLGPYRDLAHADRVRARLKQKQIDAIVVKESSGG